ncbi:MAG: primosomal protein N' [Alphaproteobacteria bacterium]
MIPYPPPTTNKFQVLLPLALDGANTNGAPESGVPVPGSFVRVPLGPRQVLGVVWDRDTARPDPAPSKLRAISAVLPAAPMPADLRAFVDWIAAYTLSPPGQVLRMCLRVGEALEAEKTRTGYALSGPPPARMTPARLRVLEVVQDGFARTARELAAAAGVGTSVVAGLAKAGTLATVALPAFEAFSAPQPEHQIPDLSPEQTQAADRLRTLVIAQKTATVLLDGVTGSGKTEVYFEAVAQALRQGKQALVLLPEIALTTQFLTRFEERFGVAAAEWHSAMTRRGRERVWRGVASGAAKVVIGARSALYLPFADLGLIVVDEEHEAAFKQSDGVTYHGRDMAVLRGRLADAPVVLATATPSLESHVNAQSGKYERLVLHQRHAGAALPDISLIDLRAQKLPAGTWLAPSLVTAISETVGRGEQALVFLNRRGFAPLTLCRKCGHRFACPNCDAWLVEHRFIRQLKCHHCGFSRAVARQCPACSAPDMLVACGPGVERIHEEVAGLFPQAKIAIMSSDRLRSIGEARALMQAIKAREFDIIVGTQLVAKGHHFPYLSLVGVVDADFGLNHGDPRAAERTYQLMHQVAGRAGREQRRGRVLLQTHMPDHPVLAALVTGERDAFYACEADMRKSAGLPPFGRLAGVLVSAPDKARSNATARALTKALPTDPRIQVLGPAEAPIAVLRGRHRVRFLLKAQTGAPVQDFLRAWLKHVPERGGVRISVDIDPTNFL